MPKGIITVENGVVVAVQTLNEGFGQNFVGGQTLYDTLKSLEKAGWKPEDELQPFTSQGKYTITIVKPE